MLLTFGTCDGHDFDPSPLAVTFSFDLRALVEEIVLALLRCGHRVPEIAVATRCVLRIRQGR